MRRALAAFAVSLCLFGAAAIYSQLVANSRYLSLSSAVLRDWSTHATLVDDPDVLIRAAEAKARVYEDLIQRTHLEDGMVVNRGKMGLMLDHCDSLLFSSLRFVGLTKLRFEDDAADAWSALEGARGARGWHRHPRCTELGTSRDMLLGLLVALSQEPAGFESHLQALIRQVDRNGGYFSTGPVYVSYLTPGVARLLAMLAPASNLAEQDLPPIVRGGYSTHELTLYATKRGYQAHLVALTVWLEMELLARHAGLRDRGVSVLESSVDRLVEPFAHGGFQGRRLDWATHQLVQLDHRNLFFRYLRLRAAGALTRPVASGLLKELLAMTQFPSDRLPANCDRRADYLWQRASREHDSTVPGCTREYHGADFLWMAGLLVEALQSTDQAALSH